MPGGVDKPTYTTSSLKAAHLTTSFNENDFSFFDELLTQPPGLPQSVLFDERDAKETPQQDVQDIENLQKAKTITNPIGLLDYTPKAPEDEEREYRQQRALQEAKVQEMQYKREQQQLQIVHFAKVFRETEEGTL